jgi:riboflavin biosynthesis pyrimidine reductase
MTRQLRGLEPLLDTATGSEMPLPDVLARFYGSLRLRAAGDHPHLFGNFVSSLDGVVALGEPGTGGDEISGKSREDHAVMGLLRAVADVIVVGAGTLRAFPQHVWTPEAIYAPGAEAYAELRRALGKKEPPLTVMVTAQGNLDPTLPVFASGRAPCLVVTTGRGARALAERGMPVEIRVAGDGTRLRAGEILEALRLAAGTRVLLECGPHLMANFFEEGKVDELFLTLAPQVAGRSPEAPRDGFVAGALLLPDHPTWGDLQSVRRCGSLLFLRYQFPASISK